MCVSCADGVLGEAVCGREPAWGGCGRLAARASPPQLRNGQRDPVESEMEGGAGFAWGLLVAYTGCRMQWLEDTPGGNHPVFVRLSLVSKQFTRGSLPLGRSEERAAELGV